MDQQFPRLICSNTHNWQAMRNAQNCYMHNLTATSTAGINWFKITSLFENQEHLCSYVSQFLWKSCPSLLTIWPYSIQSSLTNSNNGIRVNRRNKSCLSVTKKILNKNGNSKLTDFQHLPSVSYHLCGDVCIVFLIWAVCWLQAWVTSNSSSRCKSLLFCASMAVYSLPSSLESSSSLAMWPQLQWANGTALLDIDLFEMSTHSFDLPQAHHCLLPPEIVAGSTLLVFRSCVNSFMSCFKSHQAGVTRMSRGLTVLPVWEENPFPFSLSSKSWSLKKKNSIRYFT